MRVSAGCNLSENTERNKTDFLCFLVFIFVQTEITDGRGSYSGVAVCIHFYTWAARRMIFFFNSKLPQVAIHHTTHPKSSLALSEEPLFENCAVWYVMIWFLRVWHVSKRNTKTEKNVGSLEQKNVNLLLNGKGKIDSYCVTTCQKEECRYTVELGLFSK